MIRGSVQMYYNTLYTWLVTFSLLFSPNILRKHSLPHQCLVVSSWYPNCIHNDVTAQHLGLTLGSEKLYFLLKSLNAKPHKHLKLWSYFPVFKWTVLIQISGLFCIQTVKPVKWPKGSVAEWHLNTVLKCPAFECYLSDPVTFTTQI